MKDKVESSPCAGLSSIKQNLLEDSKEENGLSNESSGMKTCVKEEGTDEGISTLNLIFGIKDPCAIGLSTCLEVLKKFEARIIHLETRPAAKWKNRGDDLEWFVKCDIHSSYASMLPTALDKVADDVRTVTEETFPSFPRTLQDLDKCHRLIFKYDPHLNEDHPGFGDQEYKKRRSFFTKLAFNYKSGDILPRVEYTTEENATWKQLYKTLHNLHSEYACEQYINSLQLLEEVGIFREDSVPQLQDVSNFLQERTGFTLRPVAGLLDARDFLACLAFRVFPTTQFLRHPSDIMHSREPDCCHEMLGHVPMLSDKEFAHFSQDIGLASLGASDGDIMKLSSLYWFTVEFGLCKQKGSIKAYGAALLSSYGELLHALSNKPEHRPFDPEVMAVQPYQDASYQPVYFVSENFEDSKDKLREYAKKMKKPFSIRYDAFTRSIEVLDSLQKVKDSFSAIKADLRSLCFALDKFCQNE
ncbi:tyrosine 3-monooxygenase [Xenopus laevis]|uniref:Tyrosine 3-monooxygenase n=1 Tax=Xenopus laevis TaxID=8355 RepID=A0A8J1MMD1_XENLA|nr:tyrosine 3-monooxygenase [Xenopus laevis]